MNQSLSEVIPDQLKDIFTGLTPTAGQVREYFRAAEVPLDARKVKMKQRLMKLAKILNKKSTEQFSNPTEELQKGLTKEGSAFPGEALHLNIYPFYFEKWVVDLMTS